jgi:hypothetical protein
MAMTRGNGKRGRLGAMVLITALLLSSYPGAGTPDQLSAATFLGGTAEDSAQSIVCDASGNMYVTGYTGSSAFPTTVGAYSRINRGGMDIFVTKMDPTGSSVVWSTLVGGTGNDWGYDIALDSEGNVVVAGISRSMNFPVSTNCYDGSSNGDYDIVVFKLNPSGSKLVASTYLGGSDYDKAFLTLDASDDIYLTGYSESTDYPTTSDAYDTTADGSYFDIVVTKMEADCSDLVYSTYLGGTSSDYCYGSAVVDQNGNLWATGTSMSSDFPTTQGCYDGTKDQQYDVVVFRLDPEGAKLTASTFIGGSGFDDGWAIAINPDGNVMVLGSSSSSDYPVTTGAFDTSNNGSRDAVLTVLDKDLTKVLRSTYMGGSKDEYCSGLDMDRFGTVYVVGYTESSDFPMRQDHYDGSHNGLEDIFIARLSPDLGSLLNSSYLGGVNSDRAFSMDLGPSGDACLAGYTYSSDFPATTGSFDTTHNGEDDGIVVRFQFPPDPDRDNDGFPDAGDVFPDNPFEAKDTDGDGMGDNLDPDADGDHVNDERDAFPLDRTEWMDTDGDGIGDNADADDDNDGVNDTSDAFPRNPFEFADADRDGIGDNLDPDDDDDGKSDADEMRATVLRDVSTVNALASTVQSTLEGHLRAMNASLIGTLSDLETDFLAELAAVNATLASGILSSVRTINDRISTLDASVTNDVEDLRSWMDQVLTALDGELAGTNSTLIDQMDQVEGNAEDLYDALSTEIYLLMARLARIDSDLAEEDTDIRGEIAALSAMLADLEGTTLAEMGEMMDRLSTNVSVYDRSTADDLAGLSAKIATFEQGTNEDMEGIETSLGELATLGSILDDLEALDSDLKAAQDELDRSVQDAGEEQTAGSHLNMVLVVLVLVLLVVALLLLITMKRPSMTASLRFRREEDIIVSADAGDEGGDVP